MKTKLTQIRSCLKCERVLPRRAKRCPGCGKLTLTAKKIKFFVVTEGRFWQRKTVTYIGKRPSDKAWIERNIHGRES